jgi:hypothetical protein
MGPPAADGLKAARYRIIPASEAAISPPPHDGMHLALAAHRRCQIAAAYFYAGDLRKAAQLFREVEAEKDSPWREIAPFLAARAPFRAGLLNGDREASREDGRVERKQRSPVPCK